MKISRKCLPGLLIFILLAAAAGFASPALAQSPCGAGYTVVYGDTLGQIADRCDVTVTAILRENPEITNPNRIEVGQRLALPAPPPRDITAPTTYTVRPGDTLNQIATRFGTTTAAIVSANPEITDPNLIYANQRITIQPERSDRGPTVTISPPMGPPGTEVRLRARSLPPNTPVDVGLGRANSEYGVVDRLQTTAQGTLRTTVTIPAYADLEEQWVAVVKPVDRLDEVVSNIFSVVDQPPPEGPLFSTVQVYLIDLEAGGDVGCNDRVVAVDRAITPTRAPLQAAIRELLAIEQRTTGPQDLYNALHRSDLQLESAAIRDGLAVLHLTGELRVGGVCDNPRLEAQLKQTARQFETVDAVDIFINDRPLAEFAAG